MLAIKEVSFQGRMVFLIIEGKLKETWNEIGKGISLAMIELTQLVMLKEILERETRKTETKDQKKSV